MTGPVDLSRAERVPGRSVPILTVLRCAGWIAFAVAAIAYYPRYAKNVVNLTVYVKGAACLWDGRAMLDCAPDFTYPPAVALSVLPLVSIAPETRLVVWYVLSLLALIACIALCERLAARLYPGAIADKRLIVLRPLLLALSLKFVLVVLNYQSYDLMVFALILLGLEALARRREAAAGAALALAAAVKATPLIVLPYLVVKRRFTAAAILAAGLLVCSLLPDLVSAARGMRSDYVQNWIGQVAGPALTPGGQSGLHFWQGWMGPSLDNLSLRGVLNRLAPEPVLGVPPRAILGLALLATASALAVVILRSPRRDEFVGVDGAVLLIGMLALSPISSRYHFILLMLPYAVILASAMCEPRLRALAVRTLAASFVLVTGTSNDVVGQTVAEFAHAHGFMLFGALILLVPLAAMVGLGRADEALPGAGR